MSAAIDQPHPSEMATGVSTNWMATFVLSASLVIYAATRVLESFAGAPKLSIIALHVLLPAVFAAIHGGILYRVRSILIFFTISLIVGNIFENAAVITSFPFGRYYFTDLMGPKLFHVPILLGLAYLGMGYFSWTLALIILGNVHRPLTGSRVVTLPLVASLIMVAWDLSQDPIWSTVLHGWVWVNGGAYFGVPVTNFLGWYVDVYVIYQVYALYLRSYSTGPRHLPSSYWNLAVLFYAAVAAGNVFQIIPQPEPAVVIDPTGAQWRVGDITHTCALVSIFTMGAFAALAWARLMDQKGDLGQSLRAGAGRGCS
jgi:uncharacterized membrane protein